MKSMLSVAAFAGAALLASAAAAQDASAAPTFGQVSLSTGFPNDPHTIRVVAGGPVNGAALPGSCVGNIGNAPDYRVRYSGNGAMPLFIRTISSADTTLIINGPDGRWHCDDDGYGDLDAQVRFNNPQAGVYDIWVGAFNGHPEATLVITEIQ